MRLALAQYAIGPDPAINLLEVLRYMEQAASRRADLIVFPELCLSPFFPQFAGSDASKYAMRIQDECIRQIQRKCRELRIAASPNVYLEEGQSRFDASLMIDTDGEIRGVSKMVHIVQAPGFYEQDYYTPSDTGFKTYDMDFAKVGVVVCFDRHYPESTRTCTLRGAELVIIPTANRMDEPLDLFEAEVRAAAMQNGIFIAMCNRVGREEEAVFCGESIVVDPDGNVVSKAEQTAEIVTVDLDLRQVGSARLKRPYLALRRPESYER